MAVQEALCAGDEVWEAAGSSDEEDVDSDAEPCEATPHLARSPVLASPAVRPAPAAPGTTRQEETAPAGGMAALLGHLRCDNLKLREALVEAQREAERLALALQQEVDERLELQRRVELMRAAAGAGEEGCRGIAGDPSCEVAAFDFDGKRELEQQLVTCKLKCAEAVERAESLEVLVEHYKGQPCTFSPCSQSSSNSSDASSTTSLHSGKEKNSGRHMIKKWAGRVLKPHGSHGAQRHREADASPALLAERVPGSDEDMARQREVIACLMAELEKASQKISHLQGKVSRREERKAARAAAAA